MATAAVYTPTSPAMMPSRHTTTPPPINDPPIPDSGEGQSRPSGPRARLTNENLRKQNEENDNVGMTVEEKKKQYSMDLYEFTKNMCDGINGKVEQNSNESSNGSSTLSMASLSLKDSNDKPKRVDTPEVSASVGAVPAIH